LVAILGNFVNRVVVLSNKYFDGVVKEWNKDNITAEDKAVIEAIESYPEKIAKNIESYRFREALQEYMNLVRVGNKYLTDTEPWKLFKESPERVGEILHMSLQLIANLSILGEVFLPFTSAKIKQMLDLNGPLSWHDAGRLDTLSAGTTIGKPVHLFDKIDDKMIEAQLEKLRMTKEVQAKAQNNGQIKKQKPMIQFDDFTKLDLRIGTIVEAEKMPKADKLLVLKVDMGDGEQRTIVSGIAEHYAPEDILSKQVVVLINLEPRKLRGVLSEGMVLMAENEEGKLSFVSPDKVISSGSVVR
jgi:methionyl-tRNA synthetase